MRRLFSYEKKKDPVATPRVFYNRLARNGILALVTVAVSLAIGTAGYAWFEQMALIDAFANASMILSTMGPLTPLHTTAGKLFVLRHRLGPAALRHRGPHAGPCVSPHPAPLPRRRAG